MPKLIKNKILFSVLVSMTVLVIYILYYKFFYNSSEPCHLIDCMITEEHIKFAIKPSCCPYTKTQIIKEIASVLLPSFLISYIILLVTKRKKKI